jgi:hypothetical protein
VATVSTAATATTSASVARRLALGRGCFDIERETGVGETAGPASFVDTVALGADIAPSNQDRVLRSERGS